MTTIPFAQLPEDFIEEVAQRQSGWTGDDYTRMMLAQVRAAIEARVDEVRREEGITPQQPS